MDHLDFNDIKNEDSNGPKQDFCISPREAQSAENSSLSRDENTSSCTAKNMFELEQAIRHFEDDISRAEQIEDNGKNQYNQDADDCNGCCGNNPGHSSDFLPNDSCHTFFHPVRVHDTEESHLYFTPADSNVPYYPDYWPANSSYVVQPLRYYAPTAYPCEYEAAESYDPRVRSSDYHQEAQTMAEPQYWNSGQPRPDQPTREPSAFDTPFFGGPFSIYPNSFQTYATFTNTAEGVPRPAQPVVTHSNPSLSSHNSPRSGCSLPCSFDAPVGPTNAANAHHFESRLTPSPRLSPQLSRGASPAPSSPVTPRHSSDSLRSSAGARSNPFSDPDSSHPKQTIDDVQQMNLEEEARRQLIFEARGRQLLEAQSEITRLKDSLSQAEGLARHRELLARDVVFFCERIDCMFVCLRNLALKAVPLRVRLPALAEIEALTRELARVEAKNEEADKNGASLAGLKAKLEEDLTASTQKVAQLEEKLKNMEATNASLSAELVKLTSGSAVSLAKQREAALSEGLARRYAAEEDVVREALDVTKRRLLDKENELAELRKDLEAERFDSREARKRHTEVVAELEASLKASQERCSELSSSALCSELTELRVRLQDALNAKQITDDINEILQEELRDTREQLALYEQTMGLSQQQHHRHHPEGGNTDLDFPSARSGIDPSWSQSTPGVCEALPLKKVGETAGESLPTLITRQRRRRRSCQSVVTFALSPTPDDQPPRPASAVAPLCSTKNTEHGSDADDFTFTPRGGVTVASGTPSRRSALGEASGGSCEPQPAAIGGSLPATEIRTVSDSKSVNQLQRELRDTLAAYRSKRQQITHLHETLFSTRCELRKAVLARDNAESARTELQMRVRALEKELGLHEEFQKPGARESALVGQIERLQADYSRQESELQNARTRLQDALAAEARALATERAARERLEASAAEREAAVERARAMCEAHYTAARRRLESEWNNEHDRIVAQAKQEVAVARQETAAARAQAERLQKLYQEARESTAKAVELTLHEAMKEREKERIRFWREELPRQLDQARSAWLSSPEAQQALSAAETLRIRSALQAEFDGRLAAELTAQQQKLTAANQVVVQGLRTEVDVLRSKIPPVITLITAQTQTESSFASNTDSTGSSLACRLPILTECLSTRCVEMLLGAILPGSQQDTQSLLLEAEDHLSSVLSTTARALLRQVHSVIAEDVRRIMSEFQLLDRFGAALGPANACSDPSLEPAEPVQNSLLTLLGLPEGMSSPEPVLRCMRGLAIACLKAPQNGFASAAGTSLPLAYLDKFKDEVRSYVASCQSRSARVLQSNLARMHRRACRQFAVRLRSALSEAGATLPLEGVNTAPKTSRAPNVVPRIQLTDSALEALLHIIDAVCTATQSAFSEDSRQGRPVFSPRKVSTPSASHTSATGTIQESVLGTQIKSQSTNVAPLCSEASLVAEKESNQVRSAGRDNAPIPAPRRRPTSTPIHIEQRILDSSDSGKTNFLPELKHLFDGFETKLSAQSPVT
ncbi:unnamed protein product [Schistocephalus solidus]|uniref:Uncharacterized protein n=1 Tax=Schistocephalus solidus TaxID=70667 RepID=A0A3P7DZ61_SCHSO|nr:unnamed protein product [Schistocephalus solidus]